MKILMVSEFFPPVMGGLERHVAELSKALAGKGHKVKVLTLGWKGQQPYEKRDGLEIFRIPGIFQRFGFLYGNKNRRFHPPIPDPILVKKISRFIEGFRPDAIHCHGWIIYSVLQTKKIFNVPLTVTLHDYGLICPMRTLLRGNTICQKPFTTNCVSCAKESLGIYKSRATYWAIKINRRKLKSVDKFIAVSSFVKDAYQKHLGIDDNKICVIPNFHSSVVKEERSTADIELPVNFILLVGTFSFSKGVDVLVNAYKKIKKDVKLVLIGLKQQNFNIQPNENIVILENQPHHVVMEAWRRCRFGVIPSIWPEPCPTVALEAMACGKAVIASDIGGLKDIVINKKTGILVKPGDEDELTRAMVALINNNTLANQMGEKGFQQLQDNFIIESVLEKIELAYSKVLETKIS